MDGPDERLLWLTDRLKMLQARAILKGSLSSMPPGLVTKLKAAQPDERNSHGEPLVIALVRSEMQEAEQMSYMQTLETEGADLNAADDREKRTALMYACMEDRVDLAKMLLRYNSVNLRLQDRLGNTALMFASLKGQDELVSQMSLKLTQEFGLTVLNLKNCMGNSAEDLAIRNNQFKCARMLQMGRLKMLNCMNKQLAVLQSGEGRYWKTYTSLYKCIDKWKPKQRRKSVAMLPNCNQLQLQQIRDRKQSF